MSEEKNEYKIEGRPSTIFRVVKNKENPYAQIDRRVIENADLSFKARGILIYLLSKPDGWEVNMVDINNRSTDGMAAVRSGVKELQAAGYLKHERIHNQDTGVIAKHIWAVYESPIAPHSDIHNVDTPPMGVDNHNAISHIVDNPHYGESHLSNKVLKKELTTTDTSKEVFRTYQSEIGVLTPRISDSLGLWLDDPTCPSEWIVDVIKIAADQNKRNWAYCEAILKRWVIEGKTSVKKDPVGPKYANKREELFKQLENA